MAASLNIVLFFSSLSLCCGTIILEQPPISAAAVGSTVDLRCRLRLDGELVTRINLYWLSLGLNGTSKNYLFPSDAADGIFKGTSVELSNPGDTADMSVRLSNLSLPHTATYLCHVSVVVNSTSRSVSGNRTFLVVHEPLDASHNETHFMCTTKVQTLSDLSLLVECEDGTLVDSDHNWLDLSDNSYRLSISVPKSTSQCQSRQNVTYTCLLRYKGTSVARTRTEITCIGLQEAQQPILLYGLLLGSSSLILIVLLIVWRTNVHRTSADRSPYTNISGLKRARCLKG